MECKYCGEEVIQIETPNECASGGQRLQIQCEPALTAVWRIPDGKRRAVTEAGEVVRCEFEPVDYVQKELAYVLHSAVCKFKK